MTRTPASAGLAVLVAALLVATSACASSGRTGGGLGAAPPSTPTHAGTPAPATTAPSDRPAPPPETDCPLSQLAVSDQNGGAGSTHRSVILIFRNTSSVICHLTGYPGVAALNSNDQQIAQATRTLHGYLGGSTSAATVTLAAGASASATVEALAIDATTGNGCTPYAGILVTPPNETHSIKLAWPGDGCSSLEIHPVVPGTTGSLT
jgi:Protein of unknown function (DUF4232)